MSRPTILIADDDRGLIHLLTTVLKPLDVHVLPVHDAMTALNQIHKSHPEIIILDVNMPSGNGLSVCEMLATDRTMSQIPVIVFTGEAGHARIRSVALGATYVQKGVDAMHHIKELVTRILQDTQSPMLESQLFIG